MRAHSRSRFSALVRQGLLVLGMLAVIVGMMAWLMGAFHRKINSDASSGVSRPAAGVPVVAVEKLRLPVNESAVGSVRPVHETGVGSKILAKVLEVRIRAGQPVHKDDVLVQLDAEELKAQLDQAAAALNAAQATRNQAQVEFDRVKRLFDQKSAAQIELDRADTSLKSAQAEVERADQRLNEAKTVLSYATIRSPISGIIFDKKVDVGDTVTPGQVVATMYDPTHMQLVASVRESLTHRLKVGQQIGVRIDSLNLACSGQISEIVPEASSASRSFAVKVTGPCPPGVYTGMFGRLIIPLDETEVLAIPASAVRQVGQLNIVDVAEADRLLRRSVMLGRELDGGRVQVLSGLREGERVALTSAGQPADTATSAPAVCPTQPVRAEVAP